MATRTTSLLLIVALLICPVRCGSGVCASVCCSAPPPATTACPDHRAGSCCCCCEESDDVGDDVPGEVPARPPESPEQPPESAPCQGICGGAVFEKSVEIPTGDDVFSSVAVAIGADGSATASTPHANLAPLPREPANFGRGLRTLHMSFLC